MSITRTSLVEPSVVGLLVLVTFILGFVGGRKFSLIVDVFTGRANLTVSGDVFWNWAGLIVGGVFIPVLAAIANHRELMKRANPNHVTSVVTRRALVGGVMLGYTAALLHVFLVSVKVNFG